MRDLGYGNRKKAKRNTKAVIDEAIFIFRERYDVTATAGCWKRNFNRINNGVFSL